MLSGAGAGYCERQVSDKVTGLLCVCADARNALTAGGSMPCTASECTVTSDAHEARSTATPNPQHTQHRTRRAAGSAACLGARGCGVAGRAKPPRCPWQRAHQSSSWNSLRPRGRRLASVRTSQQAQCATRQHAACAAIAHLLSVHRGCRMALISSCTRRTPALRPAAAGARAAACPSRSPTEAAPGCARGGGARAGAAGAAPRSGTRRSP